MYAISEIIQEYKLARTARESNSGFPMSCNNNSPNNNTSGTGDSVREDVLRQIEHLGTFWI